MTLMWCSYEKQPLILRAYGDAEMISPSDNEWAAVSKDYSSLNGARQIFKLKLDLVQTSCGYAVPYMQYKGERDTLKHWTSKKTPEELRAYQLEKNAESLDGKVTGIE